MPTNREGRELENIKLSLENIIRSLSAIQTHEDSAVTQEINKSKAHLVQGLVRKPSRLPSLHARNERLYRKLISF